MPRDDVRQLGKLRGLVAADRGREGPFSALVALAGRDPAAASGLAAAYSDLTADARRRLVQAVIADTAGIGSGSTASALLPLLAVESDPQIARNIADAVVATGGTGIWPQSKRRSMLAGTEAEGMLVLIRPLYGEFVEVLILTWERREITSARLEPMVCRDAVLDRVGSSVRWAARLADVPLDRAVAVVTPVLWHHRRSHGSLPEELRTFTDLFSVET